MTAGDRRVLGQLIRRIEPKDYRQGHDGHFIYNPATHALEEKLPRFGFGAKRLHYYEVICSTTGMADASGTLGPVGVTDSATGAHLRVQIGCEAWILRENAEDVIRSVAGDDPGKRLEQLICDAVQKRAAAEPASLTPDAQQRTIALTRELERQLLEQYGLSTKLKLQSRSSLDSFIELPVISIDVGLQLIDYQPEIKLKLALIAGVPDRDHLLAIDAMERRRDLTETLRRTCREFFTKVGLHQFRTQLLGPLKDALHALIDRELAAWFLQLRTLNLELLTALPDFAPFSEEETTFSIEIRGYPRKVEIRTRVQMQAQDEAKYRRAGAPPLKRWVDENVRPVVQRILFGIRYSQLYLEFPTWESQILHDLTVAAEGIGYLVKAQITTPVMSEPRLLRPFSPPVISGEFTTAIDIVATRLEIVLRLQLDTLRTVEREMDRGVDLETAFSDAARDEVVAYMHTVQPEFLFTRFSEPKDHAGNPVPRLADDPDLRPSVERALRDRIENTLSKRYGLKLLAFTVKQGSSKIRDCYLTLIQTPSIKFDVDAQLSGHPSPVTHHGALQVEAVDHDGWTKFQHTLPTPAVVAEHAADAMRTLVGMASDALSQGVPATAIRALAKVKMPERIRELLGLRVKLASWYRDRGVADVALNEAQRRELDDRLEWEIKELREAREQTEVTGEIAELEKVVKRLRIRGDHEEAEKIEGKLRGLKRPRRGLLPGPGAVSLLPPPQDEPADGASDALPALEDEKP